MRQVRTEIEITATDERVWEIITDLPAYSQWNPLIRQATGTATVGQQVTLTVKHPDLMGRTFPVTVVELTPRRVFRWQGKFLTRGLLDTDHSFVIEPIAADRVRVVQFENFSGLLVPLSARWLVPGMRKGFEDMNLALKARAEQSTAGAIS